MSRITFFVSCVAVSSLALSSAVQAAVAIVNPDLNSVQEENTFWSGFAAGDRDVRTGSAIALGVSTPLAYPAPTSASNHANATFNFSQSVFSISNIDNARTGGNLDQQHIRVSFTVDTATNFSFAGQYIQNNIADSSGRASLQNALSIRGGGTSPIPTTSIFTTDFTAGPKPLNIPTVTGVLSPGNVYVWDVFISSLASGNPAGSTATGNIALSFSAVPEPTTLCTLAAASAGLLARRRK